MSKGSTFKSEKSGKSVLFFLTTDYWLLATDYFLVVAYFVHFGVCGEAACSIVFSHRAKNRSYQQE